MVGVLDPPKGGRFTSPPTPPPLDTVAPQSAKTSKPSLKTRLGFEVLRPSLAKNCHPSQCFQRATLCCFEGALGFRGLGFELCVLGSSPWGLGFGLQGLGLGGGSLGFERFAWGPAPAPRSLPASSDGLHDRSHLQLKGLP